MRTVSLTLGAFLIGLVVGALLFASKAPGLPLGPASRPGAEKTGALAEPGASDEGSDRSPDAGRRAAGEGQPSEPAPLYGSATSFLELVRRNFARTAGDLDVKFPEDAADTVLRDAARQTTDAAERLGNWLFHWEWRRQATGTLSEPIEIVIEARGRITVQSFSHLYRSMTPFLREEPLDLTAPVESIGGGEAYVKSGVVPLDRVLLVERVEITAHLGWSRPANPETILAGNTSLQVGGRMAWEQRDIGTTRGSLLGRVKIAPYPVEILSLAVQGGGVSARATGRLVSFEEARAIPAEPLRWVPEGDDGWLGEEPVLLQVRVDHGGGNDRKVRLDGSTDRIDRVATQNLWSDTLSPGTIRDATAYAEHTGAVPPGKVYRITRIDYRALLDPNQASGSRFEIRHAGRKLVSLLAEDDAKPSGSWFEPIDIRPGEESSLEVVCPMYALGEAVLYGRLIDPK